MSCIGLVMTTLMQDISWAVRDAPLLFVLPQQNGAESVVVGTLTVDLLLGDVHSLKEKRSVVRPIVAELRRRFEVSAAETGDLDVHRRVEISVAVVASTHGHVIEVLEQCERLVAGRPEVEVLSARQRVLDDDDLD
jgi:uncharacterized protein YlxP (DUF503 family)